MMWTGMYGFAAYRLLLQQELCAAYYPPNGPDLSLNYERRRNITGVITDNGTCSISVTVATTSIKSPRMARFLRIRLMICRVLDTSHTTTQHCLLVQISTLSPKA